jgi:hypothetical protein
MTFTPSSTSSATAGFVLGIVLWSFVVKMDTILELFHIQPRRDRVLAWINKNKILTFSFTEVVNYTFHGVSSPLTTTFAIGNSIVNAIAIFIFIPILYLFKKKSKLLIIKKAA